jgi:outer membrane protein OmpA-like peptidoglycan-associated protein
MKIVSVKSTVIIGIVSIILPGCSSTEATNQVASGVGNAVGSLAGGVVGIPIAGAVVGKAVGSLASSAVRYGINYNLHHQADEIAKALHTKVDNDPASILDPQKKLIVSDHKEYVKILIRDSFLFHGNRSRLKSQASKKLDALVPVLKKYPQTIIQIAGYTDRRGSYQRNYNLSRNKAKSISDKLYRAGVDNPSTVIGCSYNKPIAIPGTQQSKLLNRRIEVYLYPNDKDRTNPCH